MPIIFCASKADVLVLVVSNILVLGLIFLISFIKEIVARYSPILDALIQIIFPLGLFSDEKANLFLYDIDERLKDLCQNLSKKTKCKGNTLNLINYFEAAEKIIKILGTNGVDGFVYFPRGRQRYPYADLNEKKYKDDVSINVESLMYIVHQLWKKKKMKRKT